MKPFRFVLLPLFAAMLFLAPACGDDEAKTDDDAVTGDTTTTATTATPEPVAPAAPANIMIAKHKVANYAKWKEGYDRGDSMRQANGLHNFVIGRGIPDSNMVLVAVKVDDVAKAKAFSKGPDLKKAMQKSGVVGTPAITILNVAFMDMAAQPTDMRRMTMLTVKDWDAWRKSFESRKQMRIDNGLTDRGFGHDVDDNHKVTLVTNIIDSAKANAYMVSDQLKQNMKDGGVVGPPNRFTYRVVQSY